MRVGRFQLAALSLLLGFLGHGKDSAMSGGTGGTGKVQQKLMLE